MALLLVPAFGDPSFFKIEFENRSNPEIFNRVSLITMTQIQKIINIDSWKRLK